MDTTSSTGLSNEYAKRSTFFPEMASYAPIQYPSIYSLKPKVEEIAQDTAQSALKNLTKETGRDPNLQKYIDRRMDAYNSSIEKDFRKKSNVADKPSLSADSAIYGESGIDKSTLEASSFGNLNLDFRTMTQQDRQKLYKFLGPKNAKLPLIEAVQLAKVMLIDLGADIKDKFGPRPVAYKDIPVKGWLSKAKSAVCSAAKKLKFWEKTK